MQWSLRQLHQPEGSLVYLRLSSRPVRQPERELSTEMRAAMLAGGYWLVPPAQGAEFAIVCCGAVVSEAMEAYAAMREEVEGMGVAVVTSADRLYADWNTRNALPGGQTCVEMLLAPLSDDARIVTVIDGHPLGLSWLGSVRGQRVRPLGVMRFGQCGDIPDLYREYRIDAQAIIEAAAHACLDTAGWQAGR